MDAGDAQPTITLGFLTVVADPQHGLFGGYLILNSLGRPLEFHCTAPVKTNRAQEILYGPTLTPFLYGEQIGQTLVAKSTSQPRVVCTDLEPVLALREHTSIPVGLVLPPTGTDGESETTWRLDSAHAGTGAGHAFSVGRNRLAVASSADQPRIVERLSDLHETFDLFEPFARIREAIAEAQRAGR